jgi:hypothetical protein
VLGAGVLAPAIWVWARLTEARGKPRVKAARVRDKRAMDYSSIRIEIKFNRRFSVDIALVKS